MRVVASIQPARVTLQKRGIYLARLARAARLMSELLPIRFGGMVVGQFRTDQDKQQLVRSRIIELMQEGMICPPK